MSQPYDEHGNPRPDADPYRAPAPDAPYGGPASGAPYGGGYGGQYGGVPSDDRTIAAVAHIATLIGMVVSVGWLGFAVPLIMWLVYKDSKPFVRQAAAGAFNFNITLLIANAIAYVLFFTLIGIPVAIVLWIAIAVVGLVCHIMGTVRAGKGEPYNYPLQIRILS